jgi:circadian clock protein KaiC
MAGRNGGARHPRAALHAASTDMTLDDRSPAARLDRLPSGIPGLDTVLDGGFFRSGVYILQGQPGSGKTIFANQLCYRHAADGGHAVYVTLLAESHSRMLQHLRSMSFFDESAIPERVSYISAFHDLESEGLKGLMGVLRREMRARHATVLVLDGLVAAAEAAHTDRELKKFVHEVQSSAVFHNCTVFLLTSGTPQRTQAEHTMVDGLIELEDRLFDARAERALHVRKFRGSGVLRGKHPLRISNDGLQVFPRIESIFNLPPEPSATGQVLSSGIPSFDALLRSGGIPAHSATVAIGSSGTGKTTLGLHFLGASSTEEPGLMFSFFEAPHRLRAKARAFGIDLPALEASGAVALMWRSQGEHVLDELAHHLLHAVRARGVKRLVIDGLGGFFESSVYPERTTRFFSCLANELRREGVTVLMTMETVDVVGSAISTPFGISGFVDNLVFLRFTESGGLIRRLLTVTKMRDSDHDPGMHLVEIGSGGMQIGGLYSLDGGDVIPRARPMNA